MRRLKKLEAFSKRKSPNARTSDVLGGFLSRFVHFANQIRLIRDSLSRFYGILSRPERKLVHLLTLVASVSGVVEVLSIFSVMPFLSVALEADQALENAYVRWFSETFNLETKFEVLLAFGTILLVLILVTRALSALVLWVRFRATNLFSHEMSSRMFKNYLQQEYVFFLNKHTSALHQNVLQEIQMLSENYIDPLLGIISKISPILMIIVFLFAVNFTATLITALVLLSIYIILYSFLAQSIREHGATRVTSNEGRFHAVSEGFAGIKEVKLHGLESQVHREFSNHSVRVSWAMTWGRFLREMPRYIVETLVFSSLIIIVITASAVTGSLNSTLPLISLFAFAAYRLAPYLQAMFREISHMEFGQPILERVISQFEQLGRSRVLSEDTRSLEPLSLQDRLCLMNVSFTYPSSRKAAVKNINLEIIKHQCIGIVGESGSGKSTLMDLLLGIFEPTSGAVIVDRKKLDNSLRARWRSTVGYVSQSIFLSDGTIAENIAFGEDGQLIDHARVIEAARLAAAHEFISRELPNGYDTQVAQSGLRLSGGQRQRIAIARALYKDPDILFFDEATSALDHETEASIVTVLKNLAHAKTIVMISHNISTLKHCDQIIELAGGEIIRSGTTAEIFDEVSRRGKLATLR